MYICTCTPVMESFHPSFKLSISNCSQSFAEIFRPAEELAMPTQQKRITSAAPQMLSMQLAVTLQQFQVCLHLMPIERKTCGGRMHAGC